MAALKLSLLPLLLVAGVSPQAAAAMSASFSWAGIAACEKISPAFTLRDVPQGTEHLRLIMHDKDAPDFQHGGSTVAYHGGQAGGQVPRGAVHYIGPCPPSGEQHHYVWTVEALDGKGRVLAKTATAGVFPMK